VGGEVKLFRYPVAEIDAARSELLFSVKDTTVNDGSGNILSGIRSDCFDLEAVVDPGTAEYIVLAARCGDEFSGAELKIRYSVSENKMYVVKGGEAWQGEYYPEVHLDADGKLRIRLMQDKICYDVFGNGGEAAVQGILYTVTGADGLYFGAEGGEARLESLDVWAMSGSPGGNDPADNGQDDGSGTDDNRSRGSGLTAGKALLIGLGAFFGTLLAAGAGFAVVSAMKRRRQKGA
jgi:sucrose-6-phosphate hydrolase SacC (GH32 family)